MLTWNFKIRDDKLRIYLTFLALRRKRIHEYDQLYLIQNHINELIEKRYCTKWHLQRCEKLSFFMRRKNFVYSIEIKLSLESFTCF